MSITEKRAFRVGEVYLFNFGGTPKLGTITEILGQRVRYRLKSGLEQWEALSVFLDRDPDYYGREIVEGRWIFKRRRIVRDVQGETKQ